MSNDRKPNQSRLKIVKQMGKGFTGRLKESIPGDLAGEARLGAFALCSLALLSSWASRQAMTWLTSQGPGRPAFQKVPQTSWLSSSCSDSACPCIEATGMQGPVSKPGTHAPSCSWGSVIPPVHHVHLGNNEYVNE